jgi:hypothetical protein
MKFVEQDVQFLRDDAPTDHIVDGVVAVNEGVAKTGDFSVIGDAFAIERFCFTSRFMASPMISNWRSTPERSNSSFT